MNILPKKSWHVLSKKNIERVRRDEAQARAEEEEKAQRAALAEQESRLGAMRKRAHERDGEEDEGWEGGRGRGRGRGREGAGRKQRREECSVTDASGHINFFTDLQKGVGLQVGNTERQKEMKQEQEQLEKRIGLLNYLVDKDKSDTAPWYIGSSRGRRGPIAAAMEFEAKRKSAKAQHRKELLDPLLDMQHYVETKKKSEGVSGKGSECESRRHSNPVQCHDRRSSSGSGECSGSKHGHKHHHKHHDEKQYEKVEKNTKKKKKEKKKEKQGGGDDLERLRRERKRREEGERARAEALIRGLEGGGVRKEGSESLAVEQVHGRYNSQFNPHLARQQ